MLREKLGLPETATVCQNYRLEFISWNIILERDLDLDKIKIKSKEYAESESEDFVHLLLDLDREF